MSPELDKQLCEKYPKIFADRFAKPTDSPIAFGIECGDGWYKIIDMLCMSATYVYSTSVEVDEEDGKRTGIKSFPRKNKLGQDENCYLFQCEPPQMVVQQIKEKFGTLRFYYQLDFDPDLLELEETKKYPLINQIITNYRYYFDGIVHMAETLSAHTCEITGKEGEMHVSNGGINGWYKTINREYAKTDEFFVSRNYVPFKDVPKQESDENE